jgi:pSer/pThr/pTyr-binding forkhead associated (FHA) protein
MDQVTLHIENSSERRDYDLGQEVTLGRTDASSLVVSDSGLSRRNTTIFRDGDLVLIVDEGSLNGTFLNGRKLSGPPEELRDGD